MGFLKERDGFKVGDKVKVVGDIFPKGHVGVIYKIDHTDWVPFDLILDNFDKGHSGIALDGSKNHWCVDSEDIVKITETKYNVGDWVNVRSYLSTEKSYGGIYPSEQMLHKVGQKVRIKAVTKTGRYKIEGSCFTWTNEMFEEVKKETPVETKTEKTHRYNVGDKVRVRADLKPSYETIYFMADGHTGDAFVGGMDHLCGEIVTIMEITSCGKYSIEGSEYNWTDEMFEDQKVEPTKNREPKVGDRIRMTCDYCCAKIGMTGVIKTKRNSDFGVEFDHKFIGGHGCSGHTKPHRGHWVNTVCFEIIDTPKYSIATVTFDNDKEYCYLCDISVKKGDKVVVPCGSCDRETIATVVKTGKYTEENAPYPIDQMKKVIRKGTDTKPTSENDFDWDKFKDNKIIVHCRTQKSWDNFLEECEKRDIKWNSDDRATYGSSYWFFNKDQSSIVKGLRGADGMTQAKLAYHREEMPTAAVYDWTSKKYVDKPVEEKKVDEKPTYKVDDRVKIKGGYCDGKTGVIYKISENCIWDVDIIVDNFTDGHDGDAHDGSKNHWYVDFDSIEKIEKVETKPTPKIEVGDVVRAITNNYGITTLKKEWEGVVISVKDDKFIAITTNCKSVCDFKYDKFSELHMCDFEIIRKNI